MIVADASVVLEVLLQTPSGRAVTGRLLADGETLHAPALIDVEVAQVLRRWVVRGELTPARAQLAMDTLAVFPLQRYTHEPLMARIWDLRDDLTVYDAAYVALAEGLRAPLFTCDKRLAGAPGIRAQIEIID